MGKAVGACTGECFGVCAVLVSGVSFYTRARLLSSGFDDTVLGKRRGGFLRRIRRRVSLNELIIHHGGLVAKKSSTIGDLLYKLRSSCGNKMATNF